MERISKREPGFDDIYSECKHATKGEHGISSDHVRHAVATEASDGRRIVLVFEAATNDYPASIPDAHFRGDKGDRIKPNSLALHCQPLAGLDGSKGCTWHTGMCRVMWDTGIGACELFKAHGDPTNPYEQPEKFWKALEDKLTDLIAAKEHIDKENELQVDHMIAMLNNHHRLRNPFYPPTLRLDKGFWVFEWDRMRWSGATISEVVKKAYVELFRS